ncbi:MAG: hypothetical protein ACTSQD_09820 [Promethearchaeota archaeon]
MEKFDDVMGPESIQTIFRLIGEHQGEEIEKRLKQTHKIDNWTKELLAEKLQNDVLNPALGEDQSEVKVESDGLTVKMKVRPFKKAGIDITGKYFCTYTEGLIETVAKLALGDGEFTSVKLRSVDNCDCEFKIKV